MTTRTEAIEAMTQLFNSAWAPTGFPYDLDNEKFKKPDNTPWARMIIRHALGTQKTLGEAPCRRFERFGSVFVQVFVPQETGTFDAGELSDLVINAYEGVRIPLTSICFLDVSGREVGPSGKWYQTNIEANFRYEEIK